MVRLKTAESVSPKHPDKMCDQISDAILDLCLQRDPNARVAIETMGGHGHVYVLGEISTDPMKIPIVNFEIENIVKKVTGRKNLKVEIKITQQSSEIARGVDQGGAGDQGIMVGFACDETPELMPLEVMLARELNQFIYKQEPYDGKTQVTIDDGEIRSIVASFQHVPKGLLESRVKDWLKAKFGAVYDDIQIYANPAGDWDLGGFDADSGLTGRKIAVDSYGPHVPIGGGAFSGKDATKVDRSAAYMARKIAVDLLRTMHRQSVYVYLAYAIGKAEPVQAVAYMDGWESFDLMASASYDLTPRGIIKALDLQKPQFEQTAKYGHFGNKFKWDM